MKTAIIGMGVIGRVHLSICQEQGFEIVGICDTEEEIRKEFSSYVPVYSNFRKMLDEIDVDVVHICTPHHLHAEMIIECLHRNIHVLAEKPLCMTYEELSAVLQAEKASKAQLGVCLQNRYNTSSLMAKAYLAKHKTSNGYGNLLWHRGREYYEKGVWRGKQATAGGGVMINQALHTLDLLQWFLGMPSACVATTNTLGLKGEIEVEDTAIGIFSGNSNFTMFASNASKEGYPVEINLLTEEGILRVTPNKAEIDGKMLTINKERNYYGKRCYGAGHKSLIEDFYSCVQEGKKFSIDGEEGAKVMRLIFAMYESNGNLIKIKREVEV